MSSWNGNDYNIPYCHVYTHTADQTCSLMKLVSKSRLRRNERGAECTFTGQQGVVDFCLKGSMKVYRVLLSDLNKNSWFLFRNSLKIFSEC